MARRVQPDERDKQRNNHPGMSREIGISASLVESTGIYSSIVRTPPGGTTRVHHHGDCETSIYILSGRARFTWGPAGTEHELIADPGDFVYIPAGEIHVESNVSLTEPLEVLVTRNCSEPVTVIVDE
ncbi:MAG: cupin domain-containing protein [Actinomycetota bacterium]